MQCECHDCIVCLANIFHTLRYVVNKLRAVIKLVGPENVMLVIIDGGSDWSAAEEMIQEFYPWISFLHCTSHEVSLIIKDCFKPEEDGGVDGLFELDEWVTDAQHWFSSQACTSFRKSLAEDGEKTAFVWPSVTRYCGTILKLKRFYSMKPLLRRVVNSGVYEEKIFVHDPFVDVINGDDKWEQIRCVITMMVPLLLLCRLADDQKPVISKLHGTQLYVRKTMETMARDAGPDSIEAKIYQIFLTRWPEIQGPIVGATYMLEPLFVDQSKHSAACTVHLWTLARKVM